MKTKRHILLTALLSLGLAGVASAELDHGDKAFFEKAAKAGMKEVTVSEQALTHLTNPGIRDFAQMMVTDHTKANQELTALAAKKGVALPGPEPKWAKKWANNDKDVDDEYVSEMADDHKEAVKLFEKASKSSDPDVAAFAQRTLPTLQHHLEMVKALKRMN